MKILCLCPKSFAANTYLLVSGNDALVIDPAVSVDAICKALDSENAKLCGILLTHGHFDHTVSVDILRDRFRVPLMIHRADAPMLTNGMINGFYDFYGSECVHRPADRLLNDGETITLGNEKVRVMSTPGHSPGSVCYICPDVDGDFIVTGDTLFSNSIGRCDLWEGNESKMIESLKKLRTLPADTQIYPGHGPDHTLGAALENALYYTDF